MKEKRKKEQQDRNTQQQGAQVRHRRGEPKARVTTRGTQGMGFGRGEGEGRHRKESFSRRWRMTTEIISDRISLEL